jgi:hypothetical protein
MYIDSRKRANPNTTTPTNFSIPENQTTSWFDQPRTINMFSPPIQTQLSDFLNCVHIKHLLIHYDAVPTQDILKLDFYNLIYNDGFLINTLNSDEVFKFVLVNRRTTPNGLLDYDCKTSQLMRIKRKGAFRFSLMDIDGNDVNVGTNGYVIALIAITPHHLRDSSNVVLRDDGLFVQSRNF